MHIRSSDPSEAGQICRSITETLPEWFGISEANEMYADKVKDCVTFSAYEDNEPVGMIAVQTPFPKNGNIFWMGVKKAFHRRGIGKKLLQFVEQYCLSQGCYSLTVETLSLQERDPHYLATYQFYKQAGFQPLFELSPYSSQYRMVYLQKLISLGAFQWIDLTHVIHENIPTWEGGCGFRQEVITHYSDCTTECQFLVQNLNMMAGIGTHVDAPAHCLPGGMTIESIPIGSLIHHCVVIDLSLKAQENYRITEKDIQEFEQQHGKIQSDTFVIFYTGWEKFWNNPPLYRNQYRFPALSAAAAKYLLSCNVSGIATDTLSPDLPEDGYPVHSTFLKSGKWIVENVANAVQMPPVGGFVLIMPIKIDKGTEAPIRLVGMK